MVYKKYIKRNGKFYGPYVYNSRRVNGKVISEYHGTGKKNYKKFILPAFGILFLIFAVFFIIHPQGKISGNVIGNSEVNTSLQNAKIYPTVYFTLISKKAQANQENTTAVQNPVNQNSPLNETPQNNPGNNTQNNLPNNSPQLNSLNNSAQNNSSQSVSNNSNSINVNSSVSQVSGSNAATTGQLDNSTSGTPSASNPPASATANSSTVSSATPTTPATSEPVNIPATTGNAIAPAEPSQSSTASTTASSTATPSETSKSPATTATSSTITEVISDAAQTVSHFFLGLLKPTGFAVSNSEIKINGQVSADNPFSYSISDGESVELLPGSVKTDLKNLPDDTVAISFKGNQVLIETNYTEQNEIKNETKKIAVEFNVEPLSDFEIKTLETQFGNYSVETTKSELFNGRYIAGYKLGDYSIEYSYDASLKNESLKKQVEQDKIKWLRDISNQLSKKTAVAENYSF